MCARATGIEVDGAPERPLGRGVVPGTELRSADVFVRHRVCGIDGEQASEGRDRLARAAVQDVGVPEHGERIGIVAGGCRKQFDRTRRSPGLGEVLTQLDADFALRDAVAEREFQRGNGVLGPALLPVNKRQLPVGVLGIRPARDDVPVQRDRVDEPALTLRVGGALKHLLEFDQSLGIVSFGVALPHGCRAAADVAKRAQPLERLWCFRRGPRGRRQIEALEQVEQHLRPIRAAGRNVRGFSRIRCEVVGLGDRQVDVTCLGPSPLRAGAPSRVSPRVTSPRSKPGGRLRRRCAMTSISEAPGSPPGTLMAAESRMVGSRSTWRTGESMTTPDDAVAPRVFVSPPRSAAPAAWLHTRKCRAWPRRDRPGPPHGPL